MSRATERELVDTRDRVRAWLERAHAADRLVRFTEPVPVPGSDLVRVTATVLPAVEVRTYARSGRQGQVVRWSVRRRVAVATAVTLPVLGAGVWLVVEVWAYRHVILGLLVVAAILAAVAGGRGGGRAVIGLFERGSVRWFRER